MNLKSYFKKIDEQLLSSKPILWVLGVHIFIPILVVVALVLFLIGFLTPVNPLMPWYTYESSFEKLSMTMILPAILLAIVFIVRQVKFNSVRVHVKLPYSYGKSFFLYYLLCFWLITALPFAGNLGSYTRLSMRLDGQAYLQDKPILGDGFRHFYLEKYGLDDEEHYYYSNYTYELNETRDSLILNRDFVTYSYRNGLDTISVAQALKEIQAFIDVSHKYQGGVNKKNPEEILRLNLASERTYPKDQYRHKRPLAFNYLVNYGSFDNNVTYHENLTKRDSIYFIMKLEFWKFYLFVPLGLSMLLFVLCASRISDFGWGMLVVALLPTVFGISVGLADYAGVRDDLGMLVFLIIYSILVLYFVRTP